MPAREAGPPAKAVAAAAAATTTTTTTTTTTPAPTAAPCHKGPAAARLAKMLQSIDARDRMLKLTSYVARLVHYHEVAQRFGGDPRRVKELDAAIISARQLINTFKYVETLGILVDILRSRDLSVWEIVVRAVRTVFWSVEALSSDLSVVARYFKPSWDGDRINYYYKLGKSISLTLLACLEIRALSRLLRRPALCGERKEGGGCGKVGAVCTTATAATGLAALTAEQRRTAFLHVLTIARCFCDCVCAPLPSFSLEMTHTHTHTVHLLHVDSFLQPRQGHVLPGWPSLLLRRLVSASGQVLMLKTLHPPPPPLVLKGTPPAPSQNTGISLHFLPPPNPPSPPSSLLLHHTHC